jgi:hypothetical protein
MRHSTGSLTWPVESGAGSLFDAVLAFAVGCGSLLFGNSFESFDPASWQMAACYGMMVHP